jgi:pyruvate-ferredoxin/flavodoxin oxidoreductase
VLSGYWPLMRYNPALNLEGKNPFQLDSKAPSIPLKDYVYQEARYTILARSNPEAAAELLHEAQKDRSIYDSRASIPASAAGNGKRAEEDSQKPDLVTAEAPEEGAK